MAGVMRWYATVVVVIGAAAGHANSAAAQMPSAIDAPGETLIASLHGEGAQIYECKAGSDGKLAWAFREPIATLLLDDRTVGHHYVGPTWESSSAKSSATRPVSQQATFRG
jgi:Protein of unknown function (DUF3455)